MYRSGPPRDRDRYPTIAAKGPLLPIRELNEPLGPTGLAFQRCLPPGVGAHARDKVEDDVPLVRLRINRVLGCVNIFILNLCCGHRRPGDVEDLTARVSFPSFFKVWFISIDIVSGNSEHNLADPGAFERLLVLIRTLVVHGWLIGPPCETWTAVRYVAMLTVRGPRPLRSAEHTWGLEGQVKGSTGKFPLETSCFGALLCYRLCRPAMACPDLLSIQIVRLRTTSRPSGSSGFSRGLVCIRMLISSRSSRVLWARAHQSLPGSTQSTCPSRVRTSLLCRRRTSAPSPLSWARLRIQGSLRLRS